MSRVVLITGATGGIGQAITAEFARRKEKLAIHTHTQWDKAREMAAALCDQGIPAISVQANLTDSEQVGKMAQQIQTHLGAPEVLVNNAGAAWWGLLSDMTDGEWNKILHTNLSSVFFTCRAFLPEMISRKRGVICNLSSILGMSGGACEAAYSAAKAGIIGLTTALAKEAGPSGVRVNCVAPGVIQTAMTASLGEEALRSLAEETPLGRLGTPEEVASAVAYLCSPEASFITGQVLSPSGGLTL